MFVEARKKRVSDGDWVVFYESPRNMRLAKITTTGVTGTNNGQFQHKQAIGMRFGQRIHTHNRQSSAVLLPLNPELWSMVLPHRTQIVYPTDMGIVTLELGIRPGSRVVESGTGSGAMTHNLARSAGCTGQIYTFEYHELRAQTAQKEFEEHGLTNVLIQHRDVCQDGFDHVGQPIAGSIDAIFLDLPEPWKAIPHTPQLFNKHGVSRICCFSPCIEQVQKTCASLVEHGFTDIKMIECLERRYETRTVKLMNVESIIESIIDPTTCGDDEKRFVSLVQTRPPVAVTKGHTAYLTFATYLPEKVPMGESD